MPTESHPKLTIVTQKIGPALQQRTFHKMPHAYWQKSSAKVFRTYTFNVDDTDEKTNAGLQIRSGMGKTRE